MINVKHPDRWAYYVARRWKKSVSVLCWKNNCIRTQTPWLIACHYLLLHSHFIYKNTTNSSTLTERTYSEQLIATLYTKSIQQTIKTQKTLKQSDNGRHYMASTSHDVPTHNTQQWNNVRKTSRFRENTVAVSNSFNKYDQQFCVLLPSLAARRRKQRLIFSPSTFLIYFFFLYWVYAVKWRVWWDTLVNQAPAGGCGANNVR